MMVIENQFTHGDVVYLKTDKDQSARIVYALKVYKGEILYEVVCGTQSSAHYDFELSSEVNVLLTTTN
jgi:hypothetical protein